MCGIVGVVRLDGGPAPSTLLLEEMGIRPGRVVVELNRDVLSRATHALTFLKEGDTVEIVHFVGGG